MPAKKVKKAKRTPTKTSVDVFSEGVLVRTYSKAQHGAKFKSLAESFAVKNDYIVK